MSKPDVSVVIRTWNSEATIGRVLERVMSQETSCRVEIVIVDSESSDRTLEIAKPFNPKVAHTPHLGWMPGRATNIGIRLASGDVCVSLSSDAVPVNGAWLQALVGHFDDPLVAGVSSRQVPPPDCSPLAAAHVACMFGPYRTIYDRTGMDPGKQFRRSSRTCVSVILAPAHAAICSWPRPVSEALMNREDREWGKAMLELGHRLVYEPRSQVFHAHDGRLAQNRVLFRRVGMDHRRITDHSLKYHQCPAMVLLGMLGDLRYFEKLGMGPGAKLWWAAKSAVYWGACTLSQIRAAAGASPSSRNARDRTARRNKTSSRRSSAHGFPADWLERLSPRRAGAVIAGILFVVFARSSGTSPF